MGRKTHFIDNQWIEGKGENFSSLNPATGDVNWQGNAATDQEVIDAVNAAVSAFEAWADKTVEDRIRYLEVFREQVQSSKVELAEIICMETGKPLWEALTEVNAIAGKVGLSVAGLP